MCGNIDTLLMEGHNLEIPKGRGVSKAKDFEGKYEALN